MMENIRFSVHIPVYNVEKYLVECVNSVLDQTFENFEIILVDDGSPDSSGEICDSFTDPRIRVFHNGNHGVLYSRYFAVAQARGEYSVFIDSDDYVDSDFLEKVNRIIEDEKCDIVVFSYKNIYEKDIILNDCLWKEKTVFEENNLSEFREKLLFNSQLNSLCLKIIRTSILQADNIDYNNIKVTIGEDLLESLYPVFNAKKIVFVPEHWYNYRQNYSSVTHTANPDRYKSILTVRKYVYSYFKNSTFFNEENRVRFANNLVTSLMKTVVDVAASDCKTEKKISVFNSIASDELYAENKLLCKRKTLKVKTRIIFDLYSVKMYNLIILLAKRFL